MKTVSCHLLRIRSKYFPHHPILVYLQHLFVKLEGQVSHPYATSDVITVLSLKGHPNIIFKTAIC
jgi:hypothetical protein